MATPKRHRLVAMVMLLALTVQGFAIPIHAASAGQAEGEVTLWTEFTAGGSKAGIEELIAEWHSKDNGITIEHRPIGNEQFFTVIRTALAGGEPPDLLQYEGYQQTRDFAEAGQLMDLTDWWNANQDRFALQSAGERACTYEGKIYCVPYTYQTGWQIYYNPEILAENDIDVPETYEEFLSAAETLKNNGVTPIALGAKDGWPAVHWYMNFLVQRCGVDQVYSAIEGSGAKFTDPCFTEAAADLQNLAQEGYFSAGAASDDYGTAQAIFLSGRAAFFQTGSWFAAGWEAQPPQFDVGIMPFPRIADAAHSNDITGAVTHVFGIPSDAENPEAAMEVLDWMASEEGAEIWSSNGEMSMVDGAVDAAPPHMQELWAGVQTADSALPWIENELPPGVGEDKVYTGTVALIVGDMTPEEFSKSVQDALEATRP